MPDQDKIYTSYTLNYHESKHKTTAYASFYLDAPSAQNQQKLELKHPAQVKYSDNQLVFDSQNRYYKKEFSGLIESYFSYADYYEITYENQAEMIDSIDFVQLLDSVSIQTDLYFQLSGNEIEDKEELIIEVTANHSEKVYTFKSDTLNNVYFYISSEDLMDFGSGLAIFTAKRVKTISELSQSTSTGGDMIIEYQISDTVKLY